MLNDGSISQWLFSTLTVHGVLSDCAAIKDRIILENVPAGEEYLDTIKRAIKSNRRLLIGYDPFWGEAYEKTIAPYTLRIFERRWYLLSFTGRHMATYALDRMTKVELTDETFEMPADFSSEAYFSDYYGVKTDDTPMAHVIVRAHRWTPDYLRTLPLHHSQQELASGEITHADSSTTPYTDFSFDIRPTDDFLNELMKFGIEVLQPLDLREKMRHRVLEMYNYYEQK